MKSKQTKKFEIDNEKYQFDQQAFQTELKIFAKANEIRMNAMFDRLAKIVLVTADAVKQWYYGNNGPSDLGMVIKIAEAIGLVDHLKLMKKASEEINMEKLSALQTESLKKVYDAIIEYLYDFQKTDGFTGALWYEYERSGSKDPEQDLYEYAENKMDEINLILQKESFYLRNTAVYAELAEYVDNDLWNVFDGKLGYAYRFEAIPRGNPTTDEDYSSALKRLNEIVAKCIK